jgi:hypothetical protein
MENFNKRDAQLHVAISFVYSVPERTMRKAFSHKLGFSFHELSVSMSIVGGHRVMRMSEQKPFHSSASSSGSFEEKVSLHGLVSYQKKIKPNNENQHIYALLFFIEKAELS